MLHVCLFACCIFVHLRVACLFVCALHVCVSVACLCLCVYVCLPVLIVFLRSLSVTGVALARGCTNLMGKFQVSGECTTVRHYDGTSFNHNCDGMFLIV